jgi:hypothetical protein
VGRGYPDYGMSPVLPFAKVFAVQDNLVATVPHSSYKEIYSITAKGIIESGYLTIDGSGLPYQVSLNLYIDGILMSPQALYNLMAHRITAETTWPYYITYYDDKGRYYVVSFREGRSFGASWVLGLNNLDAVDLSVSGQIHYSHI